MKSAADDLPPRAEMIRAMLACDTSYEGIFYTAVRTTSIFCRPTCTARKPLPENVEFFRTAADAMAAGYRPCKRCRPLQLPATPPEWIDRLIQRVELSPTDPWTDERLRREQIDPSALRRWCKQHFGMTFHAWVRARRLGVALGQLRDGRSIEDTAFEMGYESPSGFRDAIRNVAGLSAGQAARRSLLSFARLPTPLGPMIAMAEERGLVLLEFLDRPALTQETEDLRDRHGYAIAPGRNSHIEQVARELEAYFAGSLRTFTVPVHTPGNAFDVAVWAALREIPYGETRTYGDLAAQLERPGAARAVGAANGRNRIALIIPCHRVIGADGSLIGYGGGQARKAHLIQLEKASIAVRDHTARWAKVRGIGAPGDDGNSPRLPDGLQDGDSLVSA